MDLRQLLGKLDLIEGTMAKAAKNPTGPKFTGKWKGTDPNPPGRKLVGDSVEPEESILKDLSKGPTPKSKEQELAEQFEQFLQQLEEENLGVEEKRPARKGSRPQRDYGKTGEHSNRYHYNKEETDESRGHKIIATKLKDIERSKQPPAEIDLKSREAQAKADYAKYVAKMKKKNPNYVPLYKMDEAGANNPLQGTANTQQEKPDPAKITAIKGIKNVIPGLASISDQQLTTALKKAETGTTDSASAKVLAPLAGMIDQSIENPSPQQTAAIKNLAQATKQSSVTQPK